MEEFIPLQSLEEQLELALNKTDEAVSPIITHHKLEKGGGRLGFFVLLAVLGVGATALSVLYPILRSGYREALIGEEAEGLIMDDFKDSLGLERLNKIKFKSLEPRKVEARGGIVVGTDVPAAKQKIYDMLKQPPIDMRWSLSVNEQEIYLEWLKSGDVSSQLKKQIDLLLGNNIGELAPYFQSSNWTQYDRSSFATGEIIQLLQNKNYPPEFHALRQQFPLGGNTPKVGAAFHGEITFGSTVLKNGVFMKLGPREVLESNYGALMEMEDMIYRLGLQNDMGVPRSGMFTFDKLNPENKSGVLVTELVGSKTNLEGDLVGPLTLSQLNEMDPALIQKYKPQLQKLASFLIAFAAEGKGKYINDAFLENIIIDENGKLFFFDPQLNTNPSRIALVQFENGVPHSFAGSSVDDIIKTAKTWGVFTEDELNSFRNIRTLERHIPNTNALKSFDISTVAEVAHIPKTRLNIRSSMGLLNVALDNLGMVFDLLDNTYNIFRMFNLVHKNYERGFRINPLAYASDKDRELLLTPYEIDVKGLDFPDSLSYAIFKSYGLQKILSTVQEQELSDDEVVYCIGHTVSNDRVGLTDDIPLAVGVNGKQESYIAYIDTDFNIVKESITSLPYTNDPSLNIAELDDSLDFQLQLHDANKTLDEWVEYLRIDPYWGKLPWAVDDHGRIYVIRLYHENGTDKLDIKYLPIIGNHGGSVRVMNIVDFKNHKK